MIMYALVDDETDRMLGRFTGMQGFFAADPGTCSDATRVVASGRKPLSFRAIGAQLTGNLGREWLDGKNTTNVVVQVLAVDGEPIGEYFVAVAVLSTHHDTTSRTIDIDISGLMDWIPHRYAESIWSRWAVAPPARKGLWAELPLDKRQAWLEVVSLYRRKDALRVAGAEDATEFFMDGVNIEDLSSFFCALGEAINGPGGYYGWNFPALVDCLAGGFGARAPFILHWSEFDVARRSLSRELELHDKQSTELGLITEILIEAGVEIRI
jgi:hypothetical protein